MSLKIGFFSLEEHMGCTRLAIHAANHIATSEYTVAVIESDQSTDPIFQTAKAEFGEDGTFFTNRVHFYPAGTTTIPNEDIQIYDFGKIGIFQEFPDDFSKLYLCTSSEEEHLEDIKDYLMDTGTECELILTGCSKEQLQLYKSNGFKCIPLADKKEKICPYNLALQLNLLLRQNEMIPPDYKKDWQFEEIQFHYIPEPEKKGLLENLFRGKNKANNSSQEDHDDSTLANTEKKEIPETSGIQVQEAAAPVKPANIFEKITFVSVPKPQSKSEQQQEKLKIKKKKQKSLFQKLEEQYSRQKMESLKAKKKREEEKKQYEETHDMETECKKKEVFDQDVANMGAYAFVYLQIVDYEKIKWNNGEKTAKELVLTCAKALKRHFGNVYRFSEYQFAVLIHGATVQDREKINLELIKLDSFFLKKTTASKTIPYQLAYGLSFSTEGENRDVIFRIADQGLQENLEKKQQFIQQKEAEDIVRQTEIALAEKRKEEQKVIEKIQKETPNPESSPENEPKSPARHHLSNLISTSKEAKAKTVYMGHITVFVTSIRHGCGCSYTAGSIASAMTDLYDRNVHLKRISSDAPLPDNCMVKEVCTDSDMLDAIRSGLIVFDAGLYQDLSEDQMNELLRADLKVLVSTADDYDLEKVYQFIKEQQNGAYDWLYVFNHVAKNREKELLQIMDGYTTLILPQHDYAEVPAKLRKEWKEAINWQVNSFC